MSDTIPSEFTPIQRKSPFTDLIGPIYSRHYENKLVLGIRGEDKHCNGRGFIHGGILSTLADIAMGYNCAIASAQSKGMVTSQLAIDFVSSAKAGDWIEVKVDVQKVGRTLAFANCYFWVENKRIARASAVFCSPSPSSP